MSMKILHKISVDGKDIRIVHVFTDQDIAGLYLIFPFVQWLLRGDIQKSTNGKQ